MRDSVREWVQLAKEDLRQAEYLFQGAFYRGSCFAARQAVDKGLEAALPQKGWELERVHNIRRLLSISEEYGLNIVCGRRRRRFHGQHIRGALPSRRRPVADQTSERR